MRYPLLPTLLALSWPLAAGAVDAPAGLYFQHHDWVMACDNTRTCARPAMPATTTAP